MITVKLDGWTETKQMMKALPEKIQANVIRYAFNQAAKRVAERAQATTAFKDRTGRLRNSIRVKQRRMRNGMVGSDVVAETPYAHLIEFGRLQKTATGFKQLPRREFLKPALEETREETIRYITSKIRESVSRRLTKIRNG